MRNMSRNKKNVNKLLRELYFNQGYLKKNPNLHKINSYWKIQKIIPLIDKFINITNKNEIKLLDVGGGAGLILKEVTLYIEKKFELKVTKYALDLSSDILEIQKIRNPDLKKALNEDICKTSLRDNEIDLTLMIDVLEHIPHPIIALKELKRISNFVIFKTPLEDNIYDRIWDLINRGKKRKYDIETSGHINFYNFYFLKHQIEKFNGILIDYYFTNTFEYYNKSQYYKSNMNWIDKLMNLIAIFMFKISPKLTSYIFHDFVMILSECR